MDSRELIDRLDKLENEHNANIRKIVAKYCHSRNPYKKGDFFQDHIGVIEIEKIEFYLKNPYESSSCVYYGTIINKNGKPNKLGKKRWAHQSNELKGDSQ